MAQGISVKKNLSRRRLDKFIAIIGMGHIGSALKEGLIKSGVKESRIMTSNSSKTNAAIARRADWIFLAVKPAMVPAVLHELKDEIQGKVVISLAAGVEKVTLKKLAGKARIARIMPNLAIAINEGVVGVLYGNLSLNEKTELRKLLRGLGVLVEAKSDKELESVTLIAGCGPGIAAFMVNMLAENARALGIKGAGGEMVAFQTFKGTFAHMEANLISAQKLMKAVATKGGVTEAILSDLSKNGFKKNFTKALNVGRTRIKKLRK